MSNRRLVAVVAVRNNGSRLYGKPLQNLDIRKKWMVLDQVILNLKCQKIIDEIILAISDKAENRVYIDYADKKNIRWVVGDDYDVLSRLIKAGELAEASDILRVTSESPFLYSDMLVTHWKEYIRDHLDGLFQDNVVDGCGYEIIKLNALKNSWKRGDRKHRSEMCTLYMRENVDKYKIRKVSGPQWLCRKDLRLTIDYPEDLVICRRIYEEVLKDKRQDYSLKEIVEFLDKNEELKSLVQGYTEEGYETMYK